MKDQIFYNNRKLFEIMYNIDPYFTVLINKSYLDDIIEIGKNISVIYRGEDSIMRRNEQLYFPTIKKTGEVIIKDIS